MLAGYRSRSWRGRLTDLISDEALRRETVAHARRMIAEQHTYERNAHLWCEAWQQALTNARGRSGSRVAA